MRQTLEITTLARCPLACSFCPQDKLKAAYTSRTTLLTLDHFARALAKLPKHVEIHFSGFVEPFFHPHIDAMIVHACASGFIVHIYTTLVGLRWQQVEPLSQYIPHLVRVHVPDTKALVYDDALWIRQFSRFLDIGWNGVTWMTMGEMTPLVARVMEVNHKTVEKPEMLSRGGNLWDRPALGPHVRCLADRWHSNVMMPNGDVYGCCMDYALTVPLGNLFTEDYAAIYERAEAWRLSEKVNSICNQCEWAASAGA